MELENRWQRSRGRGYDGRVMVDRLSGLGLILDTIGGLTLVFRCRVGDVQVFVGYGLAWVDRINFGLAYLSSLLKSFSLLRGDDSIIV